MNTYILYAHINKINGKIYIGITGKPPHQRWKNGKGYIGSTLFYHAILKYGWENFDHIILREGMTYDEACCAERETIAKYQSNVRQYGYNLDSGGSCGKTPSDETRLRIKLHHADFSGENHPLFGCKLSEETKNKIRLKAIGRVQSEKQKAQHSKRMSGANNPRAKAVICLNTNQVFATARLGAKWSNQHDGSRIGKCCKGIFKTAGTHPVTHEPLRWAYI